MPKYKAHSFMRDIPASLTFPQTQAILILGHTLRGLYEDVLSGPMPEHLTALVHQPEARHPSYGREPQSVR
jgi:hypothetical protein